MAQQTHGYGYSSENVVPLSQLTDYEIADGSPDVTGWPVASRDDRQIGRVDDLLVDPEQMTARYLVVHLEGDGRAGAAAAGDEEVLFPVDTADVDEPKRRIRVSVASARIGGLPRHARDGAVARDYSEQFRRTSGLPATREAGDGTHLTRSAEELHVRKRQVPAGDVKVRKTVESEHVRQPVTRTREDVTVERRPVSGRAGGEIRADEIRVPVTEEQISVEKRPVVKEEIVVKKHEVEEQTDVEADLRHERIDIDRPRGERNRR